MLRRWPGGLVEFYGMTEGGGSCILEAHNFPHKLHTVGKPAEGPRHTAHRRGRARAAAGEIGEVVGRSGSMMTGYHNQPAKTREAEWYDSEGNRYIRTGDVGRFDEDGFLTLMDRRKDMVISGGFNVYPSDLEAYCASIRALPTPPWSACLRRSGARRRLPLSCRRRTRPARRSCAPGPTHNWARRSAFLPSATSTSCRAAISARC